METASPLVQLSIGENPWHSNPSFEEDDEDSPPKRWFHYFPVCVMVLMLLAPHPSWLIILIHHHLLTLRSYGWFATHLLISYTLMFLACTSLIVCLARDPGPVTSPKDALDDEETSFAEALMAPVADDFNSPEKWCKKCWAAKPERSHHCSICRRCVLKMDHHCQWMANKCIGHRTYPAFIHFLTCVVLMAMYMSAVAISGFYYAITNPMNIDETTPLHELGVSFGGLVITAVVGAFLGYHLYLISINRTTLEDLSPFLLLRLIPNLTNPHDPLPTPEHRLNYNQRRVIKRAHRQIQLYNVGWRKNWGQVFGWERRRGWVYRLLLGGAGKGDGRSFPRNRRADEMLAKLVDELHNVDKDL
ncbi:DHHC palmitoyltransferase-domain-containing protein [Thelephora terrestris]|uniref:Palmitoyltransferase n=1 Tax=Thelephora terrestris TaxID=56493 RepID=A0A9P6H2K2_9AGAM|nr:DHHC palmitoyltransferase-domain-containing protein [Thelephora terrestris]